MSIFKTLETAIVTLIKKKLKLGSLTVDNIKEICVFQEEYLKNIIFTIETFEGKTLNQLRDQYFAIPKRNDKFPNQHIILDLKTTMRGKAALYEREYPFGSALRAAKLYLKIANEVKKGAHTLITDKVIKIESARMTDVMLLGILREMDVFTRYTTYLWEYFRIVLEKNPKEQIPYRATYLAENQAVYIKLLEDVCDKGNNYSFLNETAALKRKNADLLLYANNNSFFPLLNLGNYNASVTQHVSHGILGFNIFAWMVAHWEDWKHSQYKKTKTHREWMELERAKYQQLIQDIDPNSEEAIKVSNYIQAYSNAITDLDQQIDSYEKG